MATLSPVDEPAVAIFDREGNGMNIPRHLLQWTIFSLAVQFIIGCSIQDLPLHSFASISPYDPGDAIFVSHRNPKKLFLRSEVAVVMDERDGQLLFERKMHARKPIASLTKLMTAMVILDSGLPEDEEITIVRADRDRLRGSSSKLEFGTRLPRRDLLKITLAASENRAAASLARTYPGGTPAMVSAMNAKAERLGMKDTVFRDATGLHRGNISTAVDLITLVNAAYRYPLIREWSTLGEDTVIDLQTGEEIAFVNTNRLVRSGTWEIALSKTGYTSDSGHCLVMRTVIGDRPVTMVLLNSWGTLSKFGDANRIRKWLDHAERRSQETVRSASEPTS